MAELVRWGLPLAVFLGFFRLSGAAVSLVFAAIVFWVFCFGMSRYSMYMERRLDTGHKR